jgi:transposase
MLRVARKYEIRLSDRERDELEAFVSRPGTKIAHVRRVRVVLLSAEGLGSNEIAMRLSLSVGQVSRIRRRFDEMALDGLSDRPRTGRKDHAVPREKINLVLTIARSTPPPGRVRWTTRLIGARVGLCSATVAKVLRSATEGDSSHRDGE